MAERLERGRGHDVDRGYMPRSVAHDAVPGETSTQRSARMTEEVEGLAKEVREAARTIAEQARVMELARTRQAFEAAHRAIEAVRTAVEKRLHHPGGFYERRPNGSVIHEAKCELAAAVEEVEQVQARREAEWAERGATISATSVDAKTRAAVDMASDGATRDVRASHAPGGATRAVDTRDALGNDAAAPRASIVDTPTSHGAGLPAVLVTDAGGESTPAGTATLRVDARPAWEGELMGLLAARPGGTDADGFRRRLLAIREVLATVPEEERGLLRARLSSPVEAGDELAARFHGRLSPGTRVELLATLGETASSTGEGSTDEVGIEGAPQPVAQPHNASALAPTGGGAESIPTALSSVEPTTASDENAPATAATVQRKQTSESGLTDDRIVATAAAGVEGAGAPLPHLETIQRSFGRHDVSRVRAQVGGDGAVAAGAIGAEAYAIGDRAAFAATPDPHTAAHEGAHVVQQRAGVSLRGGVGEAGDRHEQQADEVADAVVAGQSAEPILDRITEERTGNAGAGVQRKLGESLATAEVYLTNRNNARALAGALSSHLQGVAWIQPDPRLPWTRRHVFAQVLVGILDTHLTPTELRKLCHPADPLAVIDQLRPVQPASSGRLLEQIDPRPGAVVGPSQWLPSIGLAIAQMIEGSVIASLRRLGPRWVACADRGMSEEARLDETRSLVPYDALVTSHPMDRIVGQAITGAAVFDFQEDPARTSGSADLAPTAGKVRRIALVWQGARDPSLWNWVKADPPDATPEEVAGSLFGTEKNGERKTFLAYLLTAAPPLFGVPPNTAINFRDARDHAPADGKDAGPDERVMAVASGVVTSEIALHQGADEVLPRVGEGGRTATLRDLIAGNQLQLQYLVGALAPWNRAEPVGHALGFLLGKQGELLTAPDADLAAWERVFTAQRANLQRIGAGVRQVTDKAAELGLCDPAAPEAAVLCDVLAAYARAAGTSHLADTSRALIDEAAGKQAGLALLAVEGSSRGLDVAIEQLRAGTDEGDILRKGYVRQGAELQEQSVALQSRMLAGESVAPEELDQLTLQADMLALRARVRTASVQLDRLEEAAHAAGKGLTQELAASMSGDFRGVEPTCAAMRATINLALTQMDEEMAPPTVYPGVQVGEDVRRRQRVYDAGPKDPRQSLRVAQEKFQEIAGNEEFVRFLRHGASLVEWQGFRTACIQVAALVGVGIVAGAVGGLVGDAVGGLMARAGAAESITELSLGARFVAGGANVAVDAAINTAGQHAVMDQSLGETFFENLLISAGALGILGTLEANAAKVAQVEQATAGLWQKVKGGTLLVLKEGAAITGHTIMGAALGYASHKIITGKAQPPPETAREWFLQGASMAVGRYVGQSIQARIQRMRRLGGLGDRLSKRALELQELAARVEQKPEAHDALELLNRRHELLVEELRVLENLLGDDAAMKRAKLERGDVFEAMSELEGQLGSVHASGGADITFHLAGLEELVPGAVWRGTREEIQRAVDGAERQTAGTDRKVESIRDDKTGAWKLTIDGRRYEIHERVPAGGTDRVVDPAVEQALATPPALQQQIDQVTGVEKGPAYEQAKAELRRFYTEMEAEAQHVTKVQGTATDGKYGWDYGHDVQRFSHGLANVVLRIHLDAGSVPPQDIARLRQQVVVGVDRHYNFKHDVGGRRLHLEVEFVDAPNDAHIRVAVFQGSGPADVENWFVEGDPTTHAHEIGHGAFGLKDEYHDTTGRSPERATPQAPGVRTDGSLMGNYWQSTPQGAIADPATALKARHLDEIAALFSASPVAGSGSMLGMLRAFFGRFMGSRRTSARSPEDRDRIPGLEHMGDGLVEADPAKRTALADTAKAGVEEMLRLSGVDEIMPGALWAGSSEQIATVIHQARAVGLEVRVVEVGNRYKRWRVQFGVSDRILEIEEHTPRAVAGQHATRPRAAGVPAEERAILRAKAAAELKKIRPTEAPTEHASRGLLVTPEEGRRMAELLHDIDDAETIEYKAGLLVRAHDESGRPLAWYFEFRNDAHAGATAAARARAHATDERGLPAPNVGVLDVYAYLGAKEIKGRKISDMSPVDKAAIEAWANKISPLLLAGHVAVSFDGGKTLYGFTPHARGLEPQEVVKMLREKNVFPGNVKRDNDHYEAAYKMAAEEGWKIEVEHVAVTFEPSEFRDLAQLALGEMAANERGEFPHAYWFPPKGATAPPDSTATNGQPYAGECIANCATWIRFLGVPLPEQSGRMTEYMPKFEEWANADAPIAGHTEEKP